MQEKNITKGIKKKIRQREREREEQDQQFFTL